MSRVLILGTGTAVGKTHVTAALARALVATGAEVRARKPIETGIEPRPAKRASRGKGTAASAPQTDAAALDAASSVPAPRPHPLYSFREPVSPHLAARRENIRISIRAVTAWLDGDLPQASRGTTRNVMSCQLIETAGGLLSPVTSRLTNLDLALALEPAIFVLVAHDGLGVLHDVRATLLALDALGARHPDHLVLSQSREPDTSTGTNAAELPRLGLPKPVAVVTRNGPSERELAPLVRALLRRR